MLNNNVMIVVGSDQCQWCHLVLHHVRRHEQVSPHVILGGSTALPEQ